MAKKKKDRRGGAREGAGRPAKSKAERRAHQLCVYLTPIEAARVKKRAKKAGKEPVIWARSKLLR